MSNEGMGHASWGVLIHCGTLSGLRIQLVQNKPGPACLLRSVAFIQGDLEVCPKNTADVSSCRQAIGLLRKGELRNSSVTPTKGKMGAGVKERKIQSYKGLIFRCF